MDFQKIGKEATYTHNISILNQLDKSHAATLYLTAIKPLNTKEIEAYFSIEFLNFDAFPDLILAPQIFGNEQQIWFSCLQNGVLSYYLEEHLSKIKNYEIDQNNQIISGSYVQGEKRIFYEANYLFEPFFVLITQAKTNPQKATRAIYSNSCGILIGKKASLVELIPYTEEH